MADYTTDYPALRSNTGHSATTLPDPACAEIYARAEAIYGTDSPIVYPATRELVILDLLGSSSKLHDYVQNNTTEKAQQVFKNLLDLLKVWGDRRAAEEATSEAAAMGGTVHFGRPTRKPARLVEFPDPGGYPFHNWRDISRG